MSVRVELGGRSYDVEVGPGALSRVASVLTDAGAARALLVLDSGVPEAFADELARALTSRSVTVSTARVVPSEPAKSLATAEALLRDAAAAGLDRHDVVVALGGGIVGDVAGFVAATYRRGVRVVQCPTTLLAMVDASVGGKTGVNLQAGPDGSSRLLKNFVGSFHQPILVAADVRTLASLDPRVFRCGLAECIKHALIVGDTELLEWTESRLDAAVAGDEGVLTELVGRNVAVKAGVVAGDERETASEGGRALLNLGHTFGHAIETLPDASPDGDPDRAPLMHGEAVAVGTLGACALAVEMGRMTPGERDRVVTLIARTGLPTRCGGLPESDVVLARMADDKKTLGGRLRLIVPDGLGRAGIVESPDPAMVRWAIDAMRGA